MALTSGAKLGPYEILSPLGAGGMGEVYRARDTRLGRTVAIKVLNSQLVANAELHARFEREARMVSQLQHPHICVLHDVGHESDTDFLVMEFLEGESLAERLRRGPLPQAELLKIAIQIADALEKAHRAGVVHRDLKPGNVMLTKLGAKLLDFGLAKPAAANSASGARGSGSASVLAAALTQTNPTATPGTALSAAGAVIGTVQYMSPEQIQGIEADARSDIFAFGGMLFEMATGKRTFEGKTQASIVGQILAVDPPSASTIRPEVTPSLDRVIRLCLEKDTDERIQTVHDLKLNLQAISEEKPAAAGLAEQRSSTGERLSWIAGVAAALVLGALGAALPYHPAKPAPSIRASIDPPPNTFFRLTGDAAGPPVLSPDGKLVAFIPPGNESILEIWVRPINSLEARPIEGTAGANFPFWSPDSRSLGFFIIGKLKKVDVNTGSPIEVTDAQQGRGGAWGSGGTIVFSPSPNAALMKVSAAGGSAEPLTRLDPELDSHRWPFFLPDGKHFVYLALNHDPSKATNDAIYYASLDGREHRPLFRAQSNAVYANGFLLFARGDKLLAQSFDPAKGELKGEPQVVASAVINDPTTWHMDVSAAEDGLLVYSSGAIGAMQLVWLDRNGKDIGVAADNTAALARLSPQGDRVALQMETGVGTADMFVLDLARGVRTRLTFGPVSNSSPRWSHDGKWIYFASLRNGRYSIFRKLADGSSAEESVFSSDQDVFPDACSPDGKTLLFAQRASGGKTSIWVLPLAEQGKPSQIIEDGVHASFSPEGRYVAYESNESGRYEVYVVPFSDRKAKWQVSSNGGILPMWSGDGKEIFYVGLDGAKYWFVSVPVKEQGEGLQIGAPRTLISTMNGIPSYDVSRDGKKILVPRISQQGNQSVTLVTNFTEGLNK
ncbi:MAG: protein kinase domain-containing protein [Terriglobales bacterium]